MWSSVCFWKVPPNTSHNIERLCRMMCCEIVIRDLLRIRLAYKEIQSSSQFTYSSTCTPLTAAIMRIVASIIYAKLLVLSTNRMFGLQCGMVYEHQSKLYNTYTYRTQNYRIPHTLLTPMCAIIRQKHPASAHFFDNALYLLYDVSRSLHSSFIVLPRSLRTTHSLFVLV